VIFITKLDQTGHLLKQTEPAGSGIIERILIRSHRGMAAVHGFDPAQSYRDRRDEISASEFSFQPRPHTAAIKGPLRDFIVRARPSNASYCARGQPKICPFSTMTLPRQSHRFVIQKDLDRSWWCCGAQLCRPNKNIGVVPGTSHGLAWLGLLLELR